MLRVPTSWLLKMRRAALRRARISGSATASRTRGDVGGQALELLQLVEDGIEHEEAGARRDDVAQALDAGVRVAPHAHVLGQRGPAIEGAEPLGEPLAGARPVAIEGDVDALAH